MEIQDSEWPERKSPRVYKPWESLVSDYEPIKGLYSYQQAALEIADAEGWDDSKLEALATLMVSAIHDGSLPRRHHKTGAVVARKSSGLIYFVTVEDVNKWCQREGLPYQWTLVVTETLAYRFPVEEAVPTSNELYEVKPMQRSKAQEEEILAKLRSNGHDPSQLVKNKAGKPGVKKEIRMALGSKGMWSSKTVFDKAWERLANDGQLVYK
jgi:hypothetical protein